MQVSTKEQKLNIFQHGNVIFVQIITPERITLIFISKIVRTAGLQFYNFNIQNLLTFEESLKYKGDIPLVAYIDFETTAPTDECLDPENRKMFAVSYIIVLAFHPELDTDCEIIEHRFGHLYERLTSLNYLT